ncbi:MAG TPA: transglycosylase SLT domain-containing protein [Terriglobales bacterium]|jgi:soluble lytic murein transglycosylase-like protein
METADLYAAIAQAAARTSLDWWLIYSVIEQESGFDERSESGCGALGLMQLMPSSFPAWSRTSLLDPANNVKLGSEFLSECIAIWKKESPDEMVKFGLASYNGGSGYALAAQQAAGAAGQDTATWASVEPFLRQIEVAGKRPDVEQIADYVRTIWTKYERRRGHAALA